MAFYLTPVLHCPVPGLWVKCDKAQDKNKGYGIVCVAGVYLQFRVLLVLPSRHGHARRPRPWDSAPMLLDGSPSNSLRKGASPESYSAVGSALTGYSPVSKTGRIRRMLQNPSCNKQFSHTTLMNECFSEQEGGSYSFRQTWPQSCLARLASLTSAPLFNIDDWSIP